MSRFTSRHVPGSQGHHGVQQRRRGRSQRDQFLLEWIGLTVVGVSEEPRAEGYEVLDVGKGSSVSVGELNAKGGLSGPEDVVVVVVGLLSAISRPLL